MSSILHSKTTPLRPATKPGARVDHFKGTYLSTTPVVTREMARAAARTVLTLALDDADALELISRLGIKETAR